MLSSAVTPYRSTYSALVILSSTKILGSTGTNRSALSQQARPDLADCCAESAVLGAPKRVLVCVVQWCQDVQHSTTEAASAWFTS